MIGPLVAGIVFFGYAIWPRLAALMAQATRPETGGELIERFTALLLAGWAILAGILIALPWLI